MITYPQNINLNGISKIKAKGIFTLVIKQGNTPSLDVKINGDVPIDAIPTLSIKRKDDVLKIKNVILVSRSPSKVVSGENNVIINGDSHCNISEKDLVELLQTARKNKQTVQVYEGAFGSVAKYDVSFTATDVTVYLTLPRIPDLVAKGLVRVEATDFCDYNDDWFIDISGRTNLTIDGSFNEEVLIGAKGKSIVNIKGKGRSLVLEVFEQATADARAFNAIEELTIEAHEQANVAAYTKGQLLCVAFNQANVVVYGKPSEYNVRKREQSTVCFQLIRGGTAYENPIHQ